MTGRTSFGLQRRVLVSEWSLLVGMTLDAGCISTGCEPGLPEFEAAVRVVTIAALHRAFEDFVMKRLVEVGLNFVMTTDAELRLTNFQEITSGKVGLFRVGLAYESDRLRNISIAGGRV